MPWFRSNEDTKEAFPIENLPVETFGENRGDALRLLYKRIEQTDSQDHHAVLTKPMGLNPSKEAFFRRVLPILDGFDTIFQYADQPRIREDETLSNWLKTLDTLYRRLLSALEKEGLLAIESVGQELDLSHHEVLEVREDPSVPNNMVIEELVRGYRYGQKVLRDSKVVVSKNNSQVFAQDDQSSGNQDYDRQDYDDDAYDENKYEQS